MSVRIDQPEEVDMPWIRMEDSLPRDPKIAALPSNEARWAYIVLLCAAKEQEGRFASWAHLEACTPQWMWKHHAEFIEAGLLERVVDPSDEAKATFIVANWDKYQRPYDPGNAARVAKSRAKSRENGNGLDMEEDMPVTTITGNALRDGTLRDDTLPKTKGTQAEVIAWLKENGYTKPTGYVLTDLKDMLQGYGPTTVIEALGRCKSEGNRTTKALVQAAERKLRTKFTTSTRGAVPTDTSVYDREGGAQ